MIATIKHPSPHIVTFVCVCVCVRECVSVSVLSVCGDCVCVVCVSVCGEYMYGVCVCVVSVCVVNVCGESGWVCVWWARVCVRVCVCTCVVRTLTICSLSQLQEDPGVLLTRVTVLRFWSPGLFLQLEVFNLWPTSPQFPPCPAPANHSSSLYFCEFEVFEALHQMSNVIRAVG